ncbi:MAG: hypothetical protein J7513_06470 [Solirubrobacteraceae bacterium]|nr:hypothetical protein [Solirubrobacteraceae bacterium]
MSARARTFALPALAVVLVAAVLGVQLASGGTSYLPAAAASACSAQAPALPGQDDLDAITQTIVVDGVRRAACRLGTSRERLLVALPSSRDRAALARDLGVTDAALLEELRSGLLEAVARLDSEHALPPVSSLLDDFAARLGLPQLAVSAIRQIPADVVDDLLPTGDVLRRAVTTVDLAKVLDGIDDSSQLERALAPAISDAAIAEARERLSERAGALGGLLGLG